MIPEDVEIRIALHYFHRYLPTPIMEELESLLVPQYLEDEEPAADEVVLQAIRLIESALEE